MVFLVVFIGAYSRVLQATQWSNVNTQFLASKVYPTRNEDRAIFTLEYAAECRHGDRFLFFDITYWLTG